MGKEKTITISKPQLVAEGIGFGEGPLWHRDGFLIFSDVAKNRIMKLKEGKLEVFLKESGWKGPLRTDHSDQPGANGIAYDKDGYLVFCQHGSHAIARLKGDGTVETIIDHYNGKRLNSPNDLCTGSDGSIYFSDPPYGIKGKMLNPVLAQPIGGVYRWYNDTLELLSSEFTYPNGVCFSPDQKYLYIGSNHPEEKRIRRYEITEGKLSNGITFAEENADGIKTDQEGNLYLATMKGVLILSQAGEKIGFIEIPEMTTNICIHENDLFITTAERVYYCWIK